MKIGSAVAVVLAMLLAARAGTTEAPAVSAAEREQMIQAWDRYMEEVRIYRLTKTAQLNTWYDDQVMQLEVWRDGCLRRTNRAFCDTQMDISTGIVRQRFEREKAAIEAFVQGAAARYEQAMAHLRQSSKPPAPDDAAPAPESLMERMERSFSDQWDTGGRLPAAGE